MTHAETTGTQAPIPRILYIVLEDTLATIVGESLAKLDHGNQPDRTRETLANMAQSCFLVVCRLAANRGLYIALALLRDRFGSSAFGRRRQGRLLLDFFRDCRDCRGPSRLLDLCMEPVASRVSIVLRAQRE